MAILAVDYGEKRLGLAVSEGFLAKPFQVLPNNQKIFAKLGQICQKFDISKIVIGIPEGRLTEKVLKFGQTLRKKIGTPVELEEEISTTTKARLLLIEAQTSKKKRKENLDAVAAAVILQQYLNKQK